MGIESRDWYRDHHRKVQRYIERAAFRIPLGHPDKREKPDAPAWAIWLWTVFGFLLTVAIGGCVADMLR